MYHVKKVIWVEVVVGGPCRTAADAVVARPGDVAYPLVTPARIEQPTGERRTLTLPIPSVELARLTFRNGTAAVFFSHFPKSWIHPKKQIDICLAFFFILSVRV